MKRIISTLLIAISFASCSTSMEAYSLSGLRQDTRFLTDKMAYELNLSTEQYNDVYEINYDFVYGVRYLMDDVLRGSQWALNQYYDYLDRRNDDLRWVLSRAQYLRFMQIDYFFRPIYASNAHWYFRIYSRYPDRNVFYFSRPYNYRTYRGGHYRNRGNESYYRGRYSHPSYNGSFRITGNGTFDTHRRSDFGSVRVKSNSGRRPGGDDIYTTRSSNNSNRGTSVRDNASRRSSAGRKESSSRTSVNDDGTSVRSSSSSSRRSERKVDSSSRSSDRESDAVRRGPENRSTSVRSTGNNPNNDNSSPTRSSGSSQVRSSGERRQ